MARLIFALFVVIASIATSYAQESVRMERDFDIARAIRIIYGNDNGNWNPRITCNKTTYMKLDVKRFVPEGDYEAQVALLSRFHADGFDKYYMLTKTAWDSCHACSVVFGVFLWKKGDSGWQLEQADKCFGLFGNTGDFWGRMYLVPVAVNKFGVMLEDKSTFTGETSLHFALITDWKNQFKVVLDGLGENSYYGGCDDVPPSSTCFDYSSIIHFSTEPYSVEIDFSGTYPSKTRPNTFKSSLVCSYDPLMGEYVKNNDPKVRCLSDLPFQKDVSEDGTETKPTD